MNNNNPTPSHKPILSVTDVSWAVAGVTRVILTVTGKTASPNWTQLMLVSSASHASGPAHLHFDAVGIPPDGMTEAVLADVSIEREARAGEYDVTVYSATNSATTHVNYPLGDDRG